MLKKTPVKKTNKTSVTFALKSLDEVAEVGLAGEFNDWQPTEMKQRKDGTWAATVRLPNDERFEYRFVLDGDTWIADEDADDFVANPFGGRNSVCDLT